MNRPQDPESQHAQEALLLRAWADSLDDSEELPEEVLGLLDGTLQGADAERARRLLAEQPDLARAAAQFVDSLRDTEIGAGEEAPGRLLAEALDRVPATSADPAPRGLTARLLGWLSGGAAPTLGAVAAAALLVIFVARERTPLPVEEPTLRAVATDTASITIVSPEPGTELRGDVTLEWEATSGAVRYRVVIVDLADGGVIDAGRTEETRLVVGNDFLREHLGADAARSLHWIVRARLIDGTEVSSEPRRLTWNAG